jgi:hypothetical protein
MSLLTSLFGTKVTVVVEPAPAVVHTPAPAPVAMPPCTATRQSIMAWQAEAVARRNNLVPPDYKGPIGKLVV